MTPEFTILVNCRQQENHRFGARASHRVGETAPMQNRIREHREAKGWSQEKLAEEIGSSLQQVSRLERSERRLSDGWLAKFSKALAVKKADLVIELDAVVGSRPPSLGEFAKDAEEVRLLKAWRKLDPDEQFVFLKMFERLPPPDFDIDDVGKAAG